MMIFNSLRYLLYHSCHNMSTMYVVIPIIILNSGCGKIEAHIKKFMLTPE